MRKITIHSCRSTSGSGPAKGVYRAKGAAVAGIADADTIAHEVLHACGLDDIYPQIRVDSQPDHPVSIPDASAPDMLPSDWCGGYYEPGLLHG